MSLMKNLICPVDEDLLRAAPLTPRELRWGVAIRVLGCVKQSNFTEPIDTRCVWSVAVLRRAPAPARLACLYDFQGGRRFHVGKVRLLCSYPLSAGIILDKGEWVVTEYAITLPQTLHATLLVSGPQRLRLSGEESDAYLARYEARIRNASWDQSYQEWLTCQDRCLAARPVPDEGPLMSLVMPVYRTPPAYLRAAIDSVVAQTYARWELIVVNASPHDKGVRGVLGAYVSDERIRCVTIEHNLGIVGNTNTGISYCMGDYVSFFDHDDVLSPYALAEYVRAIGEHGGEVDLLYCDEDNIRDETCCLPLFKPGLNPDLLLSCNYVLHLLTIRRAFLSGLPLSDVAVEGAQDYDLTLKALHARASVVHVPLVLYHWRIHEGSIASGQEAKSYTDDSAVNALHAYVRSEGLSASVEKAKSEFSYHVSYGFGQNAPSLGVLFDRAPSADRVGVVKTYGKSLGVRSVWADLPVPCSPQTFIRILRSYDTNLVAVLARGVELDQKTLQSLCALFQRPDVFAVAPRLVRDDGLLEYSGVLLRPDAGLLKLNRLLPNDDPGYVARACRDYDAAVLSPACVILRTEMVSQLNLSARYDTPAYVLADLFLQAYQRGWRNVNRASLSAFLTRPYPLAGHETFASTERDRQLLLASHALLCDGGDPSHNSSFDPWSSYYELDTTSLSLESRSSV